MRLQAARTRALLEHLNRGLNSIPAHDTGVKLCSNRALIVGSGTRMKSLLIVYHSQSGTSAQLARAAWRGAQVEAEIDVSVMRAWDAGTLDLARADGLLLVMAENSGALCGTMKDFLDRTFYPAIARGAGVALCPADQRRQ